MKLNTRILTTKTLSLFDGKNLEEESSDNDELSERGGQGGGWRGGVEGGIDGQKESRPDETC